MIFRASSQAISEIDPDHLTVESIAKLLQCWKWWARLILSTAVRQGIVIKNEDGSYRYVGYVG